jgi:hypothetical protein
MNKLVVVSIILFIVSGLITIFGNRLEHLCTGRAANFMAPPNQGLCLHPWLFCGVKAGGRPGENVCLTP